MSGSDLNFDDPVVAAEHAAEAMRALAHATRTFDDPSDTYWTMGNVLAIASRLIQVLEQVGEAHRDNIELAHDDGGHRTAGRAFGLSAAENLHKAAIVHTEGYRRLDQASQSSGRIAWYPDEPAKRTRVPPLAAGAQVIPMDSASRRIHQIPEPEL